MKYILMILMVFVAISCNPLPDKVVSDAKNSLKLISEQDSAIKWSETNLHLYLGTFNGNEPNRVELIEKFTVQGKLFDNYKLAKEISKSFSVNKVAIEKLLNSNEKEEEIVLQGEIAEVEAKVAHIKQLITEPHVMATMMFNMYNNFEQYKLLNDSLMSALNDSLRSVARFSKITIGKYPSKKEEISASLLQIELNIKMNHSIRDSFLTQYNFRKNIKSNLANFNIKSMIDNYNLFIHNRSIINNSVRDYKTHLRELDMSYTKILDDSDADFFVTIARTTWDESRDYTEVDYTYQKIEVDEALFEYIDGLDDNAILADNTWNSSIKVYVADSIWKKLGVDTKKAWPSDHNSSEFWVAASDVIYYHKYMIEKNGKIDSTDFIVVKEADYYKYEDSDGMAIFSKASGKFNSEADTIPAIPGITQVGNETYGEWRDSTTHQRSHGGAGAYWFFYRPYMYYNTWGGTHYYNTYSTYNSTYRNRTPYYGNGGADQHYRNYSLRRGHTSQNSFRNGRSVRGGGTGGGGK